MSSRGRHRLDSISATAKAGANLPAPVKGFTGYQTLLKSYVSEGLRRDEAHVESYTTQHLSKALERRGVKEKVLLDAIAEVRGQYVIDQRKAK